MSPFLGAAPNSPTFFDLGAQRNIFPKEPNSMSRGVLSAKLDKKKLPPNDAMIQVDNNPVPQEDFPFSSRPPETYSASNVNRMSEAKKSSTSANFDNTKVKPGEITAINLANNPQISGRLPLRKFTDRHTSNNNNQFQIPYTGSELNKRDAENNYDKSFQPAPKIPLQADVVQKTFSGFPSHATLVTKTFENSDTPSGPGSTRSNKEHLENLLFQEQDTNNAQNLLNDGRFESNGSDGETENYDPYHELVSNNRSSLLNPEYTSNYDDYSDYYNQYYDYPDYDYSDNIDKQISDNETRSNSYTAKANSLTTKYDNDDDKFPSETKNSDDHDNVHYGNYYDDYLNQGRSEEDSGDNSNIREVRTTDIDRDDEYRNYDDGYGGQRGTGNGNPVRRDDIVKDVANDNVLWNEDYSVATLHETPDKTRAKGNRNTVDILRETNHSLSANNVNVKNNSL